jgi:hypothetical protein
MSEYWEAFGVLAFAKASGIAEWRGARVDGVACKAVEKLVRGTPSDEMIGKILDAFVDTPQTLVRCEAKGSNVIVDFAFDGDLLLDHGADLFGAIARAGAFGATGTIWIEDTMHPCYVLTVAAKSKLAKWDKKTKAPDALANAHRTLVAEAFSSG